MLRKTKKTADTKSTVGSIDWPVGRDSRRPTEQPATESPPLSISTHPHPCQGSLTTPAQRHGHKFNYPDIQCPGQHIPHSNDQSQPHPPRKSKKTAALKTLKKFNCFACFNQASPLSPADRKPLISSPRQKLSTTPPELNLNKHPEQTPRSDNRSVASAGDLDLSLSTPAPRLRSRESLEADDQSLIRFSIYTPSNPAQEFDTLSEIRRNLHLSQLSDNNVHDVSTENFKAELQEYQFALVAFDDIRQDTRGGVARWAFDNFFASAKLSDQGFFYVDCDRQGELCDKQGVTSIPQFNFYCGGYRIDQVKDFDTIDQEQKDKYIRMLKYMEKR